MAQTVTEEQLRDQLVALGASLFQRGYVVGGAGNMSARLPDGNLLVTPTNSCFGRLDAARLSKIDMAGTVISGDRPTKESVFHRMFYEKDASVNAVVHLHSTYLTALSCLEGLDRDNALKPFTPYYVMKVGRLQVVPYLRPSHPDISKELASRMDGSKAFLLANHGPIVIGANFEETVNSAEELEETAKLHFLLQGKAVRYLTDAEVKELQ